MTELRRLISLNCLSDIILRLAVPVIHKFVILVQNLHWVTIGFHYVIFDGCHLKICTGAVPKTFHTEYLCVFVPHEQVYLRENSDIPDSNIDPRALHVTENYCHNFLKFKHTEPYKFS